MNMQTLSEHLGLAFLAEPWIPNVFLIVLAATLANLASHFLLRHAEKVTLLTSSNWDDALIKAAKRPVPVLIWLLGIAFAAQIVGKETGAEAFSNIPQMRNVSVVVCLAWFLIRFIHLATANVIQSMQEIGEEVDRTTVDALSKLARLTVIVTTILVVMQTLGFSVSGILAAGGIGGLAVGFAAKDLLANFFGGLTIYLDRPFSVGEWIRSPDREIEGTVEYISWRHTRVRAFNKNPIYVPNSVFTTIVVENPSRMTNRRIKETIGIRYNDIDVMAPIVADVRSMLENHPEIDTSQTLIVNFNTFGPSSLDFFIYTFTRTTEWIRYHEVKQDVLLKVAEIIERHGAEIAFPTRTLHIEPSAESLPEDSVVYRTPG